MQVKLIQRETKNKGTALVLAMYYGSDRINGKLKLKRKVESLGLYLYSNPQTKLEQKENDQKLRIAQKLRAEREMQLLSGKYDIILEDEKKQKKNKGVRLIPYMETLMNDRIKKGIKISGWNGALKHLRLFCENNKNLDIALSEVAPKFLLDYQKYLKTTTITKGEKPLLQNSQNCYYNKVYLTLRTAYENEIISQNPCKKVESVKSEQTMRTYLTLDEIKLMAQTDCRCNVLKRAFLFSCYTGLRWSDLNLLLWKQVIEEDGGYKINFRQKKTKQLQYHYINKQAVELMGERQEDEGRVFKGLRYSTEMNTRLAQWAMFSGVKKHVTFHVARHTHATLLITNGADLYVVKELLGHSEIKTTQIYAKIVDKKKLETIGLLPEIDIKF